MLYSFIAMPRRKNNELSLKERAFVTNYFKNGGNQTQAAVDAYNVKSRRNGTQVARLVMKRPAIQEEINTILDNSHLSLTDITKLAKKGITKGLEEGKPSFAAAMNMIQFNYRLHNVLPANKSISASIRVGDNSQAQNMEDIKKSLENLNTITQKLLEDTTK